MLQPYPDEVRKRAVELVLKEGKSYKVAAEITSEEFNTSPISKSTVYNWVRLEKEKMKKEKEKEKEIQETPEEKPESENQEVAPEPKKEVNESVDTVSQKIEVPPKKDVVKNVEAVKKELGTDLPVVSPQEVASQIQQNISTVPPGPLVVEPQKSTTPPEVKEKKGFLDKIREFSFATNHAWIYIAILAGITFAALAGYKLATRKRKEPEPVYEVEEEESKPEEPKPPYYSKAKGVLISDLE